MLLSVCEGPIRSVGDLLREWRRRRRMSQLDLAMEAEISARHLSFLETGRSQPSRDMLLPDSALDPIRSAERLLSLLDLWRAVSIALTVYSATYMRNRFMDPRQTVLFSPSFLLVRQPDRPEVRFRLCCCLPR
jgi:transcriptional regulator with XRE-family HTH domain